MLGLALLVRVMVSPRPFEGFGRPAATGACALALLAGWTLASGSWSDAESRAILEFDRVLLYGLAFALMATVPWTPRRVQIALGGVAAAMAVACVAGFASRALPDLLPTGVNEANSRLSYPVSYWNAMGLTAALAALFSFHLAANAPSRVARAAAGAAVPVALATLLLTFSRGAIGVGIAALAAYLALTHSRAVALALLACLPGSVVALVAAYRADLLAETDYTTPAAIAQGEDLALVVAACALVTAALVVAVGALAPRLPEARRRLGTGARAAVAVGLVAAAVAVAVAAGAPGAVERGYDDFVDGNSLPSEGAQRDRLTKLGNNGRVDHWSVARDTFASERLHGSGAGTFQLRWAQDRDGTLTVSDAHSLPLETAAELGVVGLVLLALALGVVLTAFIRGALRGPGGAAQAALAAGALAWLLHASIDWDWEMPAGTLWVVALGGLAAARREPAPAAWAPGTLARVAVGIGLLAMIVTPVRAAVSQASLNDAVREFRTGDCPRAIDSALTSTRALPERPEPFQILSFCDVRLGRGALAVRIAEQAVRRDPDNWEFHYSLALVRGATGRDPRPSAARALRLNPREDVTRRAVRRFDTDSPARWRRAARTAPLPFQGAAPSGAEE